MVITSYGLSCFKVQVADTVLAIDPFGKGKEFVAPRFEAGAVILTNPEADKQISITGNPLIFATPGEYETHEITLVGFDTKEGTPFYIEWENIKLLHLGELAKRDSLESILEAVDTIDILFINTGATSSEAQKIISAIDPRIIIPMCTGKRNNIDAFVKEIGEKPERLDKLSIKSKGLPQEGRRLIVLDAERA